MTRKDADAEIAKRIDAIERLLTENTVCHACRQPLPHPALCNCAIRSTDETHHDSSCPYRKIKRVIAELRAASREDHAK